MLNNCVIVGKIKEVKQKEGFTLLLVDVKRPYKNVNGEYESDLIPVRVFGDNNYGHLLERLTGIKGRIQVIDNGDVVIQSDRITFLGNYEEEYNNEINI